MRNWEVGDDCYVDGHVSQITAILDGDGVRVACIGHGKSPHFAKITREDSDVTMYRPVDELESVPASERDTLPAMPAAGEVP